MKAINIGEILKREFEPDYPGKAFLASFLGYMAQNKLWQNLAVNISPWGKRLHFFFFPTRKKIKTADSLLITRNLPATVVLTLRA